ncbi:ABC transporter ATP-binding protein [Alcaligenes endophyticus]|uniref:ABC transporter ATP-binding protein n=1 Tax=Alcaligenes endophyticus TaxID=1929088 RepID=A0ABT8EMC4_9BURK|nr:ABC transporter ATP-binding protein [Alcaligenes endophyticus]MCX5590982.1 ABC transporter ATP-binding protein [Alcaligenes endophyticus]MDN4122441.1 ABC transporter ATP-binding protein [Alcaligenes endophyticus]
MLDLLVVNQLNAYYGSAQVIFDMDLQLQRGEVVALMGRNGAGKSTTLKAIMGLLAGTQGKVELMGADVSAWPSYQRARAGLGYVPEDRRVFSDLTVLENLETGRQTARFWPDGRVAPCWSVDALLTLFPNLAERANQAAGKMSGGEQQMLTIARSLMGNPYLLLLDEPSEGVAPVIVEQMVAMILQLKQQGVSVLLSEQNLHFAALLADRVYVLDRGHIFYTGSMQNLMQEKEILREHLSL